MNNPKTYRLYHRLVKHFRGHSIYPVMYTAYTTRLQLRIGRNLKGESNSCGLQLSQHPWRI